MNKEIINFGMFLEYLYNSFSITFLMCLLGVITKEYFSAVKNTKLIPIGKIILISIFSTIIMCAISNYINIPFSLYVLLCIIVGIWGEYLIRIVTNSKIIRIFAKNLKNNIKDPIGKTIAQTVEDLDITNTDDEEKRDSDEETEKKRRDQTD